MIQIYHNARCSKSRECLSFLNETGKEFEVVDYLRNPPDYDQLKILISKLGITPIELIRKSEKIWIDNFKNESLSDDQIINAMVSHPILIERPIVISGDKAVIARPLDRMSTVI